MNRYCNRDATCCALTVSYPSLTLPQYRFAKNTNPVFGESICGAWVQYTLLPALIPIHCYLFTHHCFLFSILVLFSPIRLKS